MVAGTSPNTMEELKSMGVNYIAPRTWILVTTSADGEIVPSELAVQAKAGGLEIITLTIERPGPLMSGGVWYC